MSNPETTLEVGQIWTPAPGKRAHAREVVRFNSDLDGYPTVVYSPFWRNCGHTGTSSIRVTGFKSWIRKMQASCSSGESA